MPTDKLKQPKIHLNQHDRFTLEIKYRVPVLEHSPLVEGRIKARLLLATGLKVNSSSFTSADVQKSGIQYLRYSTPDWTLEELLEPANSQSPLYRLDVLVSRALTIKVPLEQKILLRIQSKIEREIQILGSLVRGMFNPGFLKDFPVKETEELLCRTKNLWKRMTHALEPSFLTQEVQTIFGYIHLTCLEALPAQSSYQDLARLILQELETNYPRFNPKDEKNQNRLLQWESQTKRKVQKVFFLPLDKKAGKNTTLEFLFGLAAMLAMVFSLGFGYAVTTLFAEESFGLAAGLIVAYALKDRVKDFFKNISRILASRYLPDRKHQIRDGKTKAKLGWMNDSYGFSRSSPTENPDLYQRIDPLEQGVLSNQALYWERSFTLKTQGILESHDREDTLENILRINFQPFLIHASEPKVRKDFFDGERSVPWKGTKQYPGYLEVEYWVEQIRRHELWKISLTRKGLESILPIH
jgi:hypothetical protein